MIKVDLITGFLGSGKTTFILEYVRYLQSRGLKVGIIENDFGVVNVDMMLLKSLVSDSCIIEMVSGSDDLNTYRRRFRTKLITMQLNQVDRVIIEPSGIFDVDEFYDMMNDEAIHSKMEIGSVITLVEANLSKDLSRGAKSILVGQLLSSGTILITKGYNDDIIPYLMSLTKDIKCLTIPDFNFVVKDEGYDFEVIMNSGYHYPSYIKVVKNNFKTLYFLDMHIDISSIENLFKTFDIFRVKGFIYDEGYYEINATKECIDVHRVEEGQNVLIVIGENLKQEEIEKVLLKK